MKSPIVITTPFAGGERAAEVLGVPRARAQWLIALAKESLREGGNSPAPVKAKQPRAKTKTRKRKQKKSRR